MCGLGGPERVTSLVSVHENISELLELCAGQGLGQDICNVVLSGDKVYGKDAHNDLLSDRLNAHVDVLQSMVGLERIEDEGGTLVVAVNLDG